MNYDSIIVAVDTMVRIFIMYLYYLLLVFVSMLLFVFTIKLLCDIASIGVRFNTLVVGYILEHSNIYCRSTRRLLVDVVNVTVVAYILYGLFGLV